MIYCLWKASVKRLAFIKQFLVVLLSITSGSVNAMPQGEVALENHQERLCDIRVIGTYRTYGDKEARYTIDAVSGIAYHPGNKIGNTVRYRLARVLEDQKGYNLIPMLTFPGDSRSKADLIISDVTIDSLPKNYLYAVFNVICGMESVDEILCSASATLYRSDGNGGKLEIHDSALDLSEVVAKGYNDDEDDFDNVITEAINEAADVVAGKVPNCQDLNF